MANKKKDFLGSLTSLAEARGINKEQIVDILQESFQVAFSKKFEDELNINKFGNKTSSKEDVKLPPALIRCDFDFKKGTINIYRQWEVRLDDDIEDDFIQIPSDDPKVIEKGLKVGDFYEEELDFTSLEKGYVEKFISNFKQKISKAEKDALIETYKGKIGEIVNGVVTKVDPHSVIIELNIGKYSATLNEKDWIGNEIFTVGESVKVFIKGIGKDSRDSKSGNLVQISRSCNGFLEKLFESEIHEIYDGTVIIKGVARIAGKRSKIAVYAINPDVDPCGACIGPNGSRIQAIVSQLGRQNKNNEREKIDVINYHENKGLYLAEALKPGEVIGIQFSPDYSEAKVVCENGTESAAIGKQGQNLKLATALLKMSKISVLSEDDANKENLEYTPISVFETEEKEEEKRKIREKALKLQEEKAKNNDKVVITKEETQNDFYSKDDDLNDFDTTIENEEIISEDTNTKENDEVIETPKTELIKPKKAKVEEPIETVEVNTTISLNDLEASLENEKKQKMEESLNKKKNKKDNHKENKNKDEYKKPIKKMEIYTEEELREMEDEDFDDFDDFDEDFSEYDDDDYYED